ncbi:lectin 9 [Elaeis guineensis]|uniref:Seed lectin beta chain n=1 Tax=Elaeis guineensis var. tenera TaxID=51953 RepID=A0A6I9QA46_ELAGV|nr:seed lectin beta chain [Elaeis guineensis]
MARCNSRSLHILVQLLSVLIPPVSPLSFNFSGNKLGIPNLNYSGDAYFDGSIIQLTKNQVGSSLGSSVGSATYSEPVSLWDKASGTVADFTTNFRFSINSLGQRVSGDGLAFFLSPFPFEEPSNSSGGTLGLFKNLGQSISKNEVVAVEFDSFRNLEYNDSSFNHVGIDIWSIVSKTQVDLNANIRGNVQFIASVSYNAVTQNLSVFLSNASDPRRNWSLFYVVDLRKYLPQNAAIGLSAATGALYETHSIYSWDFISSNSSSQSKKKISNVRSAVGLAVGIGILLCGLGFVCYAVWRKRASGGMEEDEMALELSINDAFERGGGPKKFSFGTCSLTSAMRPSGSYMPVSTF